MKLRITLLSFLTLSFLSFGSQVLNAESNEQWVSIPTRAFTEQDREAVNTLIANNAIAFSLSKRVGDSYILIAKNNDLTDPKGKLKVVTERSARELLLYRTSFEHSRRKYLISKTTNSYSSQGYLPEFTTPTATANTILRPAGKDFVYLVTVIDLQDLIEKAEVPVTRGSSDQNVVPQSSISFRKWDEKQDLATIEAFSEQNSMGNPVSVGNVGTKMVVLVQTTKMSDKKQTVCNVAFPVPGQISIRYGCSYTGDIGMLTIGYMSAGRALKLGSRDYQYHLAKDIEKSLLTLDVTAKLSQQISLQDISSAAAHFVETDSQEFFALILDLK